MISLFTLTTIFELKGRTKDGPALGLHTKTNLLLFAFVQNEDYIQCSVSDYMISFDFHVNFPDDFNLQKITRLLKNPEFAGYPPQLSYEETLDRKGLFCVSFSKGEGAGWGLHSCDDAANQLRQGIKEKIDVIKSVYNLEKNYGSARAFNQLEKVLARVFEAK